jgi:hypothetical protein
VNLVSAFGRGETLAVALHESGFEVKILDFSQAFAPEYHRGAGPFPVIKKEFIPAQKEYMDSVHPVPQGLTIWLKDGPIELTGPFAQVHILSHPEIQAWQTNAKGGGFSRLWLQRFLRHWASPYESEHWEATEDPSFPAELPLGVIDAEQEPHAHSFEKARLGGIEIHACHWLRGANWQGSRLTDLLVDAGRDIGIQGAQWVWCLSSHETKKFGERAARKIFWRGLFEPEWSWLSFTGEIQKGPWSDGLPVYCVMVGDVYLPWLYANACVLRRESATKFRYWLKVPTERVSDIDARRAWALELEKVLLARLPQAKWIVDSSDWSVCPNSEVYGAAARAQRRGQWKNWDWIAPETLPRLDVSARLQREAESFRRLIQWREDQKKKQGGARRDHALHAP